MLNRIKQDQFSKILNTVFIILLSGHEKPTFCPQTRESLQANSVWQAYGNKYIYYWMQIIVFNCLCLLSIEVILFTSSTCMYMLQYFLCFVQLTLKTSLGYWYKEWIEAKVKCTLYICTLKLPTKYKTFIITLLHYETLAIVYIF